MNDIRKALEAADSILETTNASNSMVLRIVGRAYLLAFLRAMPAKHTQWDIPSPWADLAAAIEKETP